MNASLLRQQPTVAGARCASREASSPATCSRPFVAAPRAVRRQAATASRAKALRPLRAAEEKVEEVVVQPLANAAPTDDVAWVPVIAPEELPKGVRKEVRVDGRTLLLFWYRNQIYCTEARSPAEGAYSEGLIKGKFTQDFAIECPTTGTLFSLKDGSIVSWYPTNPVLRALTPQCRPLELYPVKLQQDAIYVSIEGGTLGGIALRSTRGGSDTSLENNNVFYLEPKSYVEGGAAPNGDAAVESQGGLATAVTAVVGIVGVVGLVAGGIALYFYWFQ